MHQGLIRVCSKPILLSEVRLVLCFNFLNIRFSLLFILKLKLFLVWYKEAEKRESSEVRTGKWKVPTSHNYLPLFKGLLDCDNLKVHTILFVAFNLFVDRNQSLGWNDVVFFPPAGLRISGRGFWKPERSPRLSESSSVRRAGEVHSARRGEAGLVCAENNNRRGGEATSGGVWADVWPLFFVALEEFVKIAVSCHKLEWLRLFTQCFYNLLSSRGRMTPPTSCHHLTPHPICCPTRSKTSQPSSTWLTSAGKEQICNRESPEVSHWIKPSKAVIVISLLQWVVVEQTRGVFPLLDVSPEPWTHPPLHKKPSCQRLLQAAVRHHENLQENQVLPGPIFI